MNEPRDINELSNSIGEWQDKTFPSKQILANGWRNPYNTFAHLSKKPIGEIWELETALHNLDQEDAAKELADCMILLFAIANLVDVDVYDAINKKMQINRSRKWGNPDENGIVRHVEPK